MSISFRNPKVKILAREVAETCHISMTQAIIDALEEKIEKISKECSSLPDLDLRSPDEILGYDSNGLFKY